MSNSYQVFARKYRPQIFDDILGQDHVIKTLKNAINQDRISQAYLFVGPRGTGKTSIARILSKSLNCPDGPKVNFDPKDPICLEISEGRSLDVFEIDGASTTNVDQIRELRETVKFLPSSGKFKIYYIDEVHMLSTAAFNALLKVLEEPPSHVKFIFATTEVKKILPTIISRCQRFDLKLIPSEIISNHLIDICNQEGVQISKEASFEIAKASEGGMRDAQSMLDQIVSFCGNKISSNDVLDIFGFNSYESICDLAEMILQKKMPQAINALSNYYDEGKDLSKLINDLLEHFRNLLVYKVDDKFINKNLSNESNEFIKKQTSLIETDQLIKLIDEFVLTSEKMNLTTNKKLYFEVGIIKSIKSLNEVSIENIVDLISKVIDNVKNDNLELINKPVVIENTDSNNLLESIEEKKLDSPSINLKEDSSNKPLFGEELWSEVKENLIAINPMLELWLVEASFLDHKNETFSIGFPPEKDIFKSSLTRFISDIEKELFKISKEKLSLKIKIDNNLQSKTSDLFEKGEEYNNSNKQEKVKIEDKLDKVKKSKSIHNENDFYDDPLVKKALEIFEAKIVKQ